MLTPIGAIADTNSVQFKSTEIDGQSIAYREAGDPANPMILLLHGCPTSSHMFRNLILELADSFHVNTLNYPGFGASDLPNAAEYEYSFASTNHLRC